MRSPLRLLLLVGFAGIGLFFLRAAPRDVTLVYALEAAPEVRLLDVEVRRDGRMVRHAEYRFPDGAPTQVSHPVKLSDGTYEVLIRLSRQGSPPVTQGVPITISEGGPVVLAIR